MATKSKDTALAVPLSDYAVVQHDDPGRAISAMIANMGNIENLSQFDLLDRIGLPAGSGAPKFTIPTADGKEYEDTFEGVIVWHNMGNAQRALFMSGDPAPGTPPDCVSSDAKIGFGRHDIDRQTPRLQNGGYDCSTCYFATFGSSDRGDGQKCKMSRPLFIITADGVLPKLLLVPPSGLKNLLNYGRRTGSAGYLFEEVVTRFVLESGAKSSTGIAFSRIDFERVGTVDSEYREKFSFFKDQLAGISTTGTPALAAASAEADEELESVEL